MKPWFRRRSRQETISTAPTVAQSEIAADRERAAEQRANERAARHAPRRRRGFPLFSIILLVVVIFGALILYLAAQNGSFSSGGAVVDNSLSNATAPIKNAEDRAGSALEAAGQHLKQAAGTSGQ